MEIQAHYTIAPSLDTLQCIFMFKRRHSELKPFFSDFRLGGFCVFSQQRFTGHSELLMLSSFTKQRTKFSGGSIMRMWLQIPSRELPHGLSVWDLYFASRFPCSSQCRNQGGGSWSAVGLCFPQGSHQWSVKMALLPLHLGAGWQQLQD